MKFIISTFVAAVSALKAFPDFDSFHAHCAFETVSDKPCDETYSVLQKVLTDFSEPAFKDPAHGFYAKVHEDKNSQLWYTRMGAGKKYTDNMEFLFAAEDTGCKITGKSKSISLSYYDYYTNYCNIYNPLRESGLNFSEPKNSQCKFAPDLQSRIEKCNEK